MPRRRSNKIKNRKKTDIKDLKAKAKELACKGPIVQDQEFLDVQEMALTYEKALSNYVRNPTLKYLKGLVKRDTREYGIWLKCVENAKELGVDYETYIRAQFYYFDKWRQCPPKAQECCSRKSERNSIYRVVAYLSEEPNNKSTVLGPTKSYFVPDRVKAEDSSWQMRAMMQNFKTDEKGVFLHFGKQSVLYFDKEWLKNNNIYNSLVERGEI